MALPKGTQIGQVDEADQRARFTLPDSLSEGWQLAPADSEESFWQWIKDRLQVRP